MRLFIAVTTLLLTAPCAMAQTPAPLRFAELGRCPTASGTPVEQCRLGYRTYGRLNADRSNAVLVPTWAFGRSDDLLMLLGEDRWIDTTTSFVILVDKLGNGVSTSPSNSAAQPLGRFPRLAMEDLVRAQHRLVTETLGIPRLRAVVGWSMGGMQAVAWAMLYPGQVDRVVSVAGTPRMGTYEMYFVRTQLNLLRLAARAGMPHDSLSLALAELWHLVGTTPVMENELARDSVDAMLAREIQVELLRLHPEDNRIQLESIASFDAIRMAQQARAGRAKPAILLVYLKEDHVTTAESFRTFGALTGATTIELAHRCGHMTPVCDPELIGGHVRPFLQGAAPRERAIR